MTGAKCKTCRHYLPTRVLPHDPHVTVGCGCEIHGLVAADWWCVEHEPAERAADTPRLIEHLGRID